MFLSLKMDFEKVIAPMLEKSNIHWAKKLIHMNL